MNESFKEHNQAWKIQSKNSSKNEIKHGSHLKNFELLSSPIVGTVQV